MEHAISVANWPAVWLALIAFIPTLMTWWNTHKAKEAVTEINQRSKSNEQKLRENADNLAENTQATCEIRNKMDERMEQVMEAHAQIALINAKRAEEQDTNALLMERARRVIDQARERLTNAYRIQQKIKTGDKNGSLRLMVIEDDKNDAEFLGRVLSSLSFSFDQARNANEAVDLIKQHKYNAFFVDLNLRGSGLCGFELIKVIAMTCPGSLIIILTGYYDKTVEEAGRILGATAVLEKPPTVEVVTRLLDKVLNPV